jgi:hypothetical protein
MVAAKTPPAYGNTHIYFGSLHESHAPAGALHKIAVSFPSTMKSAKAAVTREGEPVRRRLEGMAISTLISAITSNAPLPQRSPAPRQKAR